MAAWQGLDGHLAQIETIARIAAQFGPHTGNFPMITEYANSDGYKLDDRALFATDGGLVADSALFRGPVSTAPARGAAPCYGSTPWPRPVIVTTRGPPPNGTASTVDRRKAGSMSTARCTNGPGPKTRST